MVVINDTHLVLADREENSQDECGVNCAADRVKLKAMTARVGVALTNLLSLLHVDRQVATPQVAVRVVLNSLFI
jgi:hypothetical protein